MAMIKVVPHAVMQTVGMGMGMVLLQGPRGCDETIESYRDPACRQSQHFSFK